MQCVVKEAIFDFQPLDGLKLVVVLPDTTERNAQAIVELGVRDADISAICLERDAIVAAVDSPVVELDTGRPDRVGTIRVRYAMSARLIVLPRADSNQGVLDIQLWNRFPVLLTKMLSRTTL